MFPSSKFLDCCTHDDGSHILFQNNGNQLPTYAAQHSRRAKMSSQISWIQVKPQFPQSVCQWNVDWWRRYWQWWWGRWGAPVFSIWWSSLQVLKLSGSTSAATRLTMPVWADLKIRTESCSSFITLYLQSRHHSSVVFLNVTFQVHIYAWNSFCIYSLCCSVQNGLMFHWQMHVTLHICWQNWIRMSYAMKACV